jgi:hypothetical protein
MSENNKKVEPPDLSLYHQNRRKFPPEELARYVGQYVAFSPNGTHILASGETEEEVERKLKAAGIPPSQAVGGFIDPPDLVMIVKVRSFVPARSTQRRAKQSPSGDG